MNTVLLLTIFRNIEACFSQNCAIRCVLEYILRFDQHNKV